MYSVFLTAIHALVLVLGGYGILSVVGAQVSQSANYRIQSDSVNFGGGYATSSSYSLESTGGEVATGESESASFKIKAGYQQMVTSYISMSGFASVVLSPTIPGITGGLAYGTTSVVVVTDSPSGYALSIASLTAPALQKGVASIADYVPSGGVPDFTFTTDANDAHFGYSPSGLDISTYFKDDGVNCNTGSNDGGGTCWEGLSIAERIIARQSTANHPLGGTTTIAFRVGIGGSVVQAPGVYSATTTLTALPL